MCYNISIRCKLLQVYHITSHLFTCILACVAAHSKMEGDGDNKTIGVVPEELKEVEVVTVAEEKSGAELLKKEVEAPFVQYVVLRKDLIDTLEWPRGAAIAQVTTMINRSRTHMHIE